MNEILQKKSTSKLNNNYKEVTGGNPQSRGEIKGGPDRNPDGTFAKGREKTGGRQAGTKNFVTLFNEALEKIAKEKKMGPDDVEISLVSRAILKARSGHFRYYQDIMDRVYGKPRQSVDLNERPDFMWDNHDIMSAIKKVYGETKQET